MDVLALLSNRARSWRGLLTVLALLGTIALSGCGRSGAAPKDPNTLIELVRTDGATMNPLFAQTVVDALVYGQLLFDSLSYTGTDYQPHPRLATSWTHSPDGLRWTVDLRRGVRWSDGVPFTSRDVAFTFAVNLDPKTASLAQSDLADYIKRVRADGPYRVIFELSKPNAIFAGDALGTFILPEHVLGSIAHDRLRFSDFGEKPVGTGPYVLQSWQHDSATVFARNPYAWRRPHIERIEVRTIFNDQSELEALANGSADLIDDLSSIQYRQLQVSSPSIKLQTFASLYLDATTPNLLHPGLSDVAVRRAMMYGQDRAAVIRGFLLNAVPLPDGLIPPGLTYWHDAHVTDYPYDPAKARALLDAAGWRPGPDGIRRRGKTRLSFELLLNQGSATYTDMMLAVVADLKAIGIEIRLRQLDFPSLISREFSGNFDLAATGTGGNVDPDLTPLLASSEVPPNGSNTSRFHDPQMDRLLAQGLRELNIAKRRAIYDRVQQIVANQVPVFYQYGRFSALAHAPRLQLDPKATLQSPLLYYNVEDWTLAK